MADQAMNGVKSAQGATSGLQQKVQSTTTGILGSIEGFGGWISAKGMQLVDRIFPPEQRASVLAKLQAFMLRNPKLSAFLGMNLALTGIPLGLFILFTLTVAIFALVVGLLLGLLAAVVFIVFAVGTALIFVLPAVFFTTMTACFLFLWGLGGFYILKWLQGGSGSEGGEGGKEGGAPIGDRLNAMTGGRLTGFMDAAKEERAKGDIKGFGDEHLKPDHSTAPPKTAKKEHGEHGEHNEHKEEKKKPAPHQANGDVKKE
ncbi:hypothetical protein BAUCODRAFT_434317 [Baudoinia panamericana UAMH 10762]|uniref:Uncharacterized protein n=1 Tax=Baudoinia panamericana (strain UAMH 10762) TaxID=717646 RepID=M2LRA4_BAUPA|nr:uncharacterized protein BAUCODRAFT_434317 [Baudoinia panamericana UAMH 10762]EMC96967.1 hypothetical protein BAUCODRAFT_434317 [Baudoinia panamericana UAMH 10762]